jgi:hypothetical protein
MTCLQHRGFELRMPCNDDDDDDDASEIYPGQHLLWLTSLTKPPYSNYLHSNIHLIKQSTDQSSNHSHTMKWKELLETIND